jgi:hypothetical protein
VVISGPERRLIFCFPALWLKMTRFSCFLAGGRGREASFVDLAGERPCFSPPSPLRECQVYAEPLFREASSVYPQISKLKRVVWKEWIGSFAQQDMGNLPSASTGLDMGLCWPNIPNLPHRELVAW